MTMWSLITKNFLANKNIQQKNKNVDSHNSQQYDKFLVYIGHELDGALPRKDIKKKDEIQEIIMKGLALLPQDRIKLSKMIKELKKLVSK